MRDEGEWAENGALVKHGCIDLRKGQSGKSVTSAKYLSVRTDCFENSHSILLGKTLFD